MVKAWKRRSPKPERHPRYTIEDSQGNYVLEIEITACGRADNVAKAVTHLPQLLHVARSLVDAKDEQSADKAITDLRSLLRLIPTELDSYEESRSAQE